MENEALHAGQVVTYVDEVGNSHSALLTTVHGSTPTSAVNLVYVSDDSSKTDPYGRQIERASSVSHRDSSGTAPGGRYFFVE